MKYSRSAICIEEPIFCDATNDCSVVSKPFFANGSIFLKSGVLRTVSYPGHTQSKADSIGHIYLCQDIMGIYRDAGLLSY